MLERIYYISNEEDIIISKEWVSLLQLWKIKFTLLPSLTDVPPKINDKCLFLCEKRKDAEAVRNMNGFVVIVCNEKNREEDFSGFSFAVEDFSLVPPIYYIKLWQRFKKIPWHITDTPRCLIREMTPSDLNAIYELYENKSVTRFMEDLFEDRDMERDYIEKYIENIYSYFGFGTWLIIRREDEKVIGRAGFNYRPDFDDPELGFMIDARYQGQGYANEVCLQLLQYAGTELGFKTVQALVEPMNTASLQLLRKLGFKEDTEYTIDGIHYKRYVISL